MILYVFYFVFCKSKLFSLKMYISIWIYIIVYEIKFILIIKYKNSKKIVENK